MKNKPTKKGSELLSNHFSLPIIVVLIIFSTIISCTSSSSSNSKDSKKPTTITGQVFVTGNEPHTWLAIRTKSGETYEITGPLAKKIRFEMQGRIITVTGSLDTAPSNPLIQAISVQKIK